MTGIKAIETRYNGYRFRSRLEARWAVFFDKCHIRYEYESEGYELPNGEKYLPDFYLPDLDVHVEVKRNTPEGMKEVLEKCSSAISWGGPIKCIVVLSDVPKPHTNDGGMWYFPCVYWSPSWPRWGWYTFIDISGDGVPQLKGTIGILRCDLPSFSTGSSGPGCETIAAQTDATLTTELAHKIVDDIEHFNRIAETPLGCPINTKVQNGLAAARSARFEHGEGATV